MGIIRFIKVYLDTMNLCHLTVQERYVLEVRAGIQINALTIIGDTNQK